ncbi:MAG: septation regulator SpoVG [Oscillospiraceae bacterium]|nr:septation regulator SpoVG [Oscillospiraceae bacterium]
MNITQVKITQTPEGGRMRAVVSVTFDNAFVVHDVKIIDGPERCFLAMPSRKMPDGTFRDIVHPINAEARTALEQSILEQFSQMQEQEKAQKQEQTQGQPDMSGNEASEGEEAEEKTDDTPEDV